MYNFLLLVDPPSKTDITHGSTGRDVGADMVDALPGGGDEREEDVELELELECGYCALNYSQVSSQLLENCCSYLSIVWYGIVR